MFGATDPPGHSGFTSVQLQSADESGPPPTAPPVEPAPVGGGGTTDSIAAVPAPPAGTPAVPAAADLDELARRLFEPLSARIRAELWLDRERAGLMTDLRP
jgi:hypothetical protein